jgi:hypothetical protein
MDLTVPAQTQRVILPSAGPCVDGDDSFIYPPIAARRLRYWKTDDPLQRDDKVVIDVSGSSALQQNGLKMITCRMRFRPTRLTFTKYSLLISYTGDAPHGMRPIEAIRVIPDLQGVENLAMKGAVPSNSYAELRYGDNLEIEHDSTVDESHRDILFVVIGALIALGAAMVLEIP